MSPLDDVEIRDFTIRRSPIKFTIDGEEYKAPPVIAPSNLQRLAGLHGQLGDLSDLSTNVERVLGLFSEMFRILLPGASGERLVERLLSETEPLDMHEQVLPIVYYLLERYGLRPTVPSSPSQPGSTDGETDIPSDGTSSTDGASLVASNI